MALKAQAISPLETIYEESSSFIASTDNSQEDYRDETINGLISARAIPTVNIRRQRTNEYEQKPPIEVRFRDGSKRYIHPSTTTTMIINRRNLLNSSDNNNNLSSNYQQLSRSNFNKRTFQTKPPLVLTIITADDLKQAGITPSRSSSASGSDISPITPSPSINSPLLSFDSLENSHDDALKQSSVTCDQSSSINNSTSNIYSSTSILPFSSTSNRTLSVPSLKTSNSSLQITLTDDENERNSSINSKLSDEIVNHAVQSNTTVSVENANHGAFRPFLKPIQFKQQPIAIKPQATSTTYRRSLNPTLQQKLIVPYSQFYQKSVPPVATSNVIRVSYRPILTQKNIVVPEYSYNSIISTPIDFNTTTNPSANLNSLLQMNLSNYQKSINHTGDNSFNLPSNSSRTLSFTTNPMVKWFNVTSNSIYDIPRLSSKYSSIPLRINLPALSPMHNQKFIIKNNTALEKRLLNAGLSPETVALYQRILDVAGNRQKNIFSSPQITDRYSYKPFT